MSRVTEKRWCIDSTNGNKLLYGKVFQCLKFIFFNWILFQFLQELSLQINYVTELSTTVKPQCKGLTVACAALLWVEKAPQLVLTLLAGLLASFPFNSHFVLLSCFIWKRASSVKPYFCFCFLFFWVNLCKMCVCVCVCVLIAFRAYVWVLSTGS